MKLTFTIIALLSLSIQTFSQQLDWAFKISSGQGDQGVRIVADKFGDVIATGTFGAIADFDPGSGTANLTPTSSSNTDIYLAKYDASGNYIWAIKIGGSSMCDINGLSTDTSGNIYVAGFTKPSTDQDGFLRKYDKNGNLKWARSFGSTGMDIAYGVATDVKHNIYVTGLMSGTVDYDPGAGIADVTSHGGRDIYIAKYDSSGNYKWAFNIGGTSSTAYMETGQDIVVSGADLYVTGNFVGTNTDFNPDAVGTALLSSKGQTDPFVAKYDTSGNFVWANNISASANDDLSYGLDVDASGNVYITGGIDGASDFDPSAGTATLTPASAGTDIFVAKYSSSGAYVWAFLAGGSSIVNDWGYDIDVNAAGDLYITGHHWGPSDFNPGAGNTSTGPSNDQIYVAKYDVSKNFHWVMDIGNTSGVGSENGRGIYAKDDGTLLVTGGFYGAADFDPSTNTYSLGGTNTLSSFIASYDGTNMPTGISNSNLNSLSFKLYPNPSEDRFIIETSGEEIQSVKIMNLSGGIIHSLNVQPSSSVTIEKNDLEPGMYFIQVSSSSNQSGTYKLVIR